MTTGSDASSTYYMATQQHIYVGLSGGVDSSVAALLLLEMGNRVTGVFMKNWSDCDWIAEERWAKKAAAHLGIPLETWDFEKEYREHILSNFYKEYKRGRTPNPDVLCNKVIKFDFFLNKALSAGADAIATGHYARVVDGHLYKGKDQKKDQSYFLYALTKKQLANVCFPLGELEKHDVRELAKRANLSNFDKKDSQGICFVGAIDVKTFLEQKLPKEQGMIVTAEGDVIGKHDGAYFYTEGQREGLYLGGLKEPHYVAYKDMKTNTLIATPKDHPLLYAQKVRVKDMHWIHPTSVTAVTAKVRYRQDDQEATISKTEKGYEIIFASEQFAMSKGQSVVAYKSDEVLGGGVIDEVVYEQGLVERVKSMVK